MVAFEVLQHTFKYNWKDISLANWFRYPNPARPDVLNIDILKRDFDPETGVLKTTRLLTMKTAIPSWLERITGASSKAYFIEEATIDPRNNKMELKAKNISFSNLLEMKETCIYSTSEENKEWTHLTQEARVTVYTFGISRRVEEFCVQSFKQNAAKGKELMEPAIQKMMEFKTKIKQEAEEKLQAMEDFGTKLKQETELGISALADLD